MSDPLTGCRVLLIDDDVEELCFVERALSDLGIGVQPRRASSAKEALHQLATSGVDLVITDLEMPEMDGFQLIQAIRGRPEWDATAILVLTRWSHRDTTVDVLDCGADAFIAKPLSPQELIARIRALLRARRRYLALNPQALPEVLPLARLRPVLRDVLGLEKGDETFEMVRRAALIGP